MDPSKIKKYFKENARHWITGAYDTDGYSYPAGLHRMQLSLNIIASHVKPEQGRLLDIGCGGGNLCIEAARLGYRTEGADQSGEMIAHARQTCAQFPEEVSSRMKFYLKSLADIETTLEAGAYDAVTALGFIGYLDEESQLFKTVNRLLKKDGLFIVSCRNRLFNMTTGSKYMRREIEQGTALSLLDELDELYQKPSDDEVKEYLEALSEISHVLLENKLETKGQKYQEKSKEQKFTCSLEARQHTPKQLAAVAQEYGFVKQGYYGVHPHFGTARLNRLLPPRVFNCLSDALIAFKASPLSLIWSSVFLGVFKKNTENIFK